MNNLWNEVDANRMNNDLELRVYSSRLLGRNPELVLHGGGNTSVKIKQKNILGIEEELLYIKGSGWDLATIKAAGFAPVKLEHMIELSKLNSMTDPEMVNELKTHTTLAAAPTPSVETILHAILPYKYVDHTHANAVVTVTNTPNGHRYIDEIYGDKVVVIPYVMPGFDLAKMCANLFEQNKKPATIGMVLMNHGIFSFGETAKESYDRMIDLVVMAEDFLKANDAWDIPLPETTIPAHSIRHELAELRSNISGKLGSPAIVATHLDGHSLAYAQYEGIASISQRGPATPDHVIRTKRLPMLGRELNAYSAEYERYFNDHSKGNSDFTMLDTAPRVIVDPGFGLCTVGKSAKDAAVVADIYRHTMDIIQRGEMLDKFQALPANDIFDVEYWDLEQAKLNKTGSSPVFSGEVALVTGASSGIGKACVEKFLNNGAAVVAVDVNPDIVGLHQVEGYLGVQCDLTDENVIEEVLEHCVRRFGGLDMLVLNAGMFPESQPVSEMDSDTWSDVMRLNVDANMNFLRESHPLIKLAPAGGRVVVIGSKNVDAPGPGAAAYSVSKAALNQLVRVTALEWGGDNIRINTVHPNAVFDTGIWTDEVLQSRAKHYGVSIEAYKKNNILKTEITSANVADMVVEMCGPVFSKTTGSQVPIDGGNDRVI